MRAKIAEWMGRNRSELLALGPYLAVALMLPGGSILATVAWLHQHHRRTELRP